MEIIGPGEQGKSLLGGESGDIVIAIDNHIVRLVVAIVVTLVVTIIAVANCLEPLIDRIKIELWQTHSKRLEEELHRRRVNVRTLLRQ